MRLRALKRQWDGLGKTDPLWAVLTLPDKRGGRWDPEEFFRTGEEEIARVLEGVRRRGLALRRERALDFGCGVGRLTQALATRFDRVDGVDIAPSMVALAERYNRHPDRCHYHLNASDDLRLFPDGSFTFVFSHLVLQHIPPRYSARYLGELVRVLAPGGLLLFNVPSHPFPAHPGEARLTRATGPLAASAFRAQVVPAQRSLTALAGQTATLKVSVRNLGDRPWPALAHRTGRYQINLGNHWLDASGHAVVVSDTRTPLPCDVAPQQEVELFLAVNVPAAPGDYLLELDMVQEGCAWFQEHGSPTARVPVAAEGLPGDGTRPAGAPVDPQAAPRPRVPFRERHPRLHRLVNPDGVRRALHRARQFLVWNVAVPLRRVRARLQQTRAPQMEMHGLPQERVRRLVQEAGGTVLDAEDQELTLAGWHSYWYWVTRP